MKKSPSFLFLILTSFLTAPCVLADLPIAAKPATLDFGQVNENKGSLELSLQIQNLSDRIVKIAQVRTDCGCTVAQLKQKNITPKDNVEVAIKINIAGSKRKFSRNIYVDIEGEKESLTIPVTGFVTSDIWFDGVMIQIFPRTGQSVEKADFVIHTIDFPKVQFDLETLVPIFSLVEKERKKIGDHTLIEYELSVDTTNINETQSYRLALLPTDKRTKPLYIPVGIYVSNKIAMASHPSKASLAEFKHVNAGLIERGVSKAIKIFLNESELKSLLIERIANFPVETKIEIIPQSKILSVTVPSNSQLGQVRGRIHFSNATSIEVVGFVIPKRQ